MSDHEDRRAWLLRAGIVSLAVFAASACAPEFEGETCSKDSDCFQDEVCIDGACRLVVSDDTDEAEDTDEETGVEDTGVDSGPEIADLNIEPPSAEIQVDSMVQLSVAARDSNGESVNVPPEVTWSSNNTDVATVETKNTPEMVEVTGESAGTAVITASLGVMDAMASVRVTEESVNNAPVADAGSDETVTVGTEVELDGSGSMDPDMDQLTYEWSFDSTPDFSSASLQDASTVRPTFTPDVSGEYTVELTVSDGDASSSDTVVITAEPGGMDADAGMDVEVGTDTGVEVGVDSGTGGDTQGSLDASDTSSSDTSDTGTSTGDTSDADSSSTGDTSDADSSSTGDTSDADSSSTGDTADADTS